MTDVEVEQLLVSRLTAIAYASRPPNMSAAQLTDRVTPLRWTRSRWGNDPASCGAYSYLPTGSGPEVFDELAARESDLLHFAGEHTQSSASVRASVHGAWLSGVRAAEQVTATLFANTIPINTPGVLAFASCFS
jgi:hypothetical protein